MKKIDKDKVIEAWDFLGDNIPSKADMKPVLNSDKMLPLAMHVLNMTNGHDLVSTVKIEGPIPVTYKGKIIGMTDAEGTIEFFDCDEAKEAIAFINEKPGPIGISSRKMGTINEDGSITEGPVTEQAIIDTPDDDED